MTLRLDSADTARRADRQSVLRLAPLGRDRWRLGGWLALCAVVGGCARAAAPQNTSGPPPPPAVVAKVDQRELTAEQTCVGTVAPLRTSTVGSPVEGRVIEFLAREGDYVRKEPPEDMQQPDQEPEPPQGQQATPLAKLRTQSLEIELAAAKAELRVREAELAELKLSAPKEIEQARLRKEAAESLREFTRSRLQRTRELVARNAASEDELEERVNAAEAAEKAFREKEAALEMAESGVWDEKIAQAAARVDAQRETVRRLQDDLDQHTVYAPFDGYVTREHTEVGQWLGKGDPIAEVADIDFVYVEAPVLEDYIARLEPGTRVSVEIGALPGQTFPGEVVAIVPQADLRSRTFPVKVRVKNVASPANPGEPMLKPGMFARVTLPIGNKTMLLVPKDALVLGGESPTVWVAVPQGDGATTGPATVERVQVEVDLRETEDRWIEILGPTAQDGSLPLKGGQLVIVEGNERIGKEGQAVNIVRLVEPGQGAGQ